MVNYYAELGVAPTATEAEIKKAYRVMVKKYHPDLHPDDPQAQKKIQIINEAYGILSDAEKRRDYDAKQRAGGQAGGATPKGKARPAGGKRPTAPTADAPPDFRQFQSQFEHFFGFEPKSGEITNEDKLKTKNPLDTSDLFEKFMGFK